MIGKSKNKNDGFESKVKALAKQADLDEQEAVKEWKSIIENEGHSKQLAFIRWHRKHKKDMHTIGVDEMECVFVWMNVWGKPKLSQKEWDMVTSGEMDYPSNKEEYRQDHEDAVWIHPYTILAEVDGEIQKVSGVVYDDPNGSKHPFLEHELEAGQGFKLTNWRIKPKGDDISLRRTKDSKLELIDDDGIAKKFIDNYTDISDISEWRDGIYGFTEEKRAKKNLYGTGDVYKGICSGVFLKETDGGDPYLSVLLTSTKIGEVDMTTEADLELMEEVSFLYFPEDGELEGLTIDKLQETFEDKEIVLFGTVSVKDTFLNGKADYLTV